MNKFPLYLVLAFVSTALWAQVKPSSSIEEKYYADPTLTRKISMDFKGADLSDVLKILSQQSGKNFIAAQEVSGKKITLFIDSISIEEALRQILDANNLMYNMDESGDVFIVRAKPDVEKATFTKVYPLKYATVSTSPLKSNSSSSGSSSGSTDGTVSGASSGTSSGASSSPASSSSVIIAALRTVMSSTGFVVEDPRTNSLIITDEGKYFPRIEAVIAKMDISVAQILIQVEMLDVSKTTSDLMGIKYGNSPLAFTGAKRDILYPWDQNMLINKKYATQPSYTVGTLDASGMRAALQFLRTQSDARNLARPRILTLNNQTADIKISTNEAIGIKSQTNASQGTSTQSIEAERVQTGVFLTVTPQANLTTREILMAVYPKVIQARIGETFDGHTFKDPEERGAQSTLKVKDGETIIIGGLLREDDSQTYTKLPILGDMPLIGSAFRHKDKTRSQRELIIFITPKIIDDAQIRQLTPVNKSDYGLRQEMIDVELSNIENLRVSP